MKRRPRSWKKSGGCPTGKRRYRDQDEAKRSLRTKKAHPEKSDGRTLKRWYKCPLCKGYHLTSQD